MIDKLKWRDKSQQAKGHNWERISKGGSACAKTLQQEGT